MADGTTKWERSERKAEYIKNIIKNDLERAQLISAFRLCSTLEDTFEKDVCNFTEDEIVELLRSIVSTTMRTVRWRRDLYRYYTDWCIYNKYSKDNINHYRNITPEILESCVAKRASKERHLGYDQVTTFINKLDNYIDKFILLALYEGLSMEEIAMIRVADVDKSNRTIQLCTGRIYHVANDWLLSLLFGADKERYQETEVIRSHTSSFMKRDLFTPSEYVVKYLPMYTTKQERVTGMITKLRRIKRLLNAPYLIQTNLFYSGFGHYLTQIAIEKGVSSIADLVLQYIQSYEVQELCVRYHVIPQNNVLNRLIRERNLEAEIQGMYSIQKEELLANSYVEDRIHATTK